MVKKCVVTLYFLAVLVAGIPGKAQGQTLVVEGGTLIDGTGRTPVKDAVVVIEGNRIKAVGTKGQVAIPPNAQIINADGKTILPGFIDAQAQGKWEFQPPILLHYGITTVYYDGTPYLYAQKELQEQGKLIGPRMFLTAGYIDGPVENLRQDRKGNAKKWPEGWSVYTPEEARAAVDKRLAEWPKASGIVVFERNEPELLRAISDQAHKHGLHVGGRAEFAGPAAENGYDSIYHISGVIRDLIKKPESVAKLKDLMENHWNLFWPIADGNYAHLIEREQMDPLVKKMVDNQVFLAPTISHEWWAWGTQIPQSKEWAAEFVEFAKNPAIAFVPDRIRNGWLNADKTSQRVKGRFMVGDQVDARRPQDLEGYKLQAEFLQKFVKAGGKLLGGGDNSFDMLPGIVTHHELEQLVMYGITPMQAILSVTKWSAEAWNKDKDLGTIEPGKLADIITVNGDPLADIRNTKKVDGMILNGKVIDLKFDPNWKNPLPDPGGLYGPPWSRL